MSDNFFNRNFVLWSTPESIEAEKVSLLAVAEVIFSVAAYWWIAWYFDTYAHLLVSVLVAPIVLLRSGESAALGLKMFVTYLNQRDITMRSTKGFLRVLSTITVAGATGWLAADWYLVGHEGWSLFGRTILFLCFALNLGFAVAGVEISDVRRLVEGEAISLVGTALVVAVAAAVAVMAADAPLYAMAVVVQTISMAMLLVVVTVTAERATLTAIMTLVILLVVPGLGVGILFRSIVVRVIASLLHIHNGVGAFPKNWRRTLFHIDVLRAPELIPGLGKIKPEYSFSGIVEKQILGGDYEFATRIGIAFLGFITFVPSLLYRYSVKSTCWLYLPLIYVAHLPKRMRDINGKLVWIRSSPAKLIEVIRLFIAAVTLAVAAAALVDATALRVILSAAGETPVSIFSLLVVLDFSEIRPWQYFTLPSAGLTVVLYFWLDGIRKEETAGATIDALGWQISAAVFASRVRDLLVYIWLGIALYYFAEFSYHQCRLPEGMMSWMEWHFGPQCCDVPAL